MWVLRHEDGKRYVAQPGRPKSFTTKLDHARRFPSKEAAKANACGDEHPVRIQR